MPSFSTLLLTSASLASLALAKTDLEGCTSSTVIKYGGASVLYYVPGTGEICDFLDCGGGRAPPKTTVPGCAAYEGTATYSPSYLPGYGGMAANTGMSSAAAASSTAASESSVDTSLPPGPRITSGSYLSLTPAGGLSVATTLSTTPPYLQASSYASSSYTYISGSSQPPSSTMAASSSSASSAAASSGTDSGSSGSGNGSSGSSTGTASSGSSSSSTEPSVAASTGGAAKLWAGSAGLLALGGIVAAL